MRLRPFTTADLPFARAQITREGWRVPESLLAALLDHDPAGSFIAEVDGAAVGMVTTTAFAYAAWLGNLIVAPAQRRAGHGRALVEHALAALAARGLATVRLEGDPLGLGIYRRLGFEDEFASPRFRRAPAPVVPPRAPAGRLHPPELAALLPLDETAFGDERPRLLRRLAADGTGYHVRAPDGYLLMQPTATGVRLGPWVASSAAAAASLLRTALATVAGLEVEVAVPGPNAAARALLLQAGFAETPSSLRMVRGPRVGAGRPDLVYALASGATG
jgi:predicted N-acetyltransferase YhbS